MSGDVRIAVCTGYGINAGQELARAFDMVGGSTAFVHVQELFHRPSLLARYHALAFPGGFSYGDHLGSGKVLAMQVRQHLRAALDAFVSDGGLVLGICNGFQVLVKAGMLPNRSGLWEPEVSLVHNDSGVFEDSWVTLEAPDTSDSPWLEGLAGMEAPVRHGEGKLVSAEAAVIDALEREGMVAFRYAGRNPNGSVNGIAGLTDGTGRVLGLMPHPEAYLTPYHHPSWTRGAYAEQRLHAGRQADAPRPQSEHTGLPTRPTGLRSRTTGPPDEPTGRALLDTGLGLFENAVRYIRTSAR